MNVHFTRTEVQGRIYSQQGPVQKKMWGPSPGEADPIFRGKKQRLVSQSSPSVCLLRNWRPFLLITLVRSLGDRPLFPACKNLPLLLRGPLFVGAPVRPNMLNMPKSAAAEVVSD